MTAPLVPADCDLRDFGHMPEWQVALLRDKKSRGTGVVTEARKAKVLAREGPICAYCGDTEGPFEFDHILPRCLGGTSDPSNLALACAPCNSSKGGRSLREWIAFLISEGSRRD